MCTACVDYDYMYKLSYTSKHDNSLFHRYYYIYIYIDYKLKVVYANGIKIYLCMLSLCYNYYSVYFFY